MAFFHNATAKYVLFAIQNLLNCFDHPWIKKEFQAPRMIQWMYSYARRAFFSFSMVYPL